MYNILVVVIIVTGNKTKKGPYPYSNYSLTLGFAAEIGFWTPDSMPEDIHTANKAQPGSLLIMINVDYYYHHCFQ